MTCSVSETVYLNRDNTIQLVLSSDGVAVADLSAITRIVVTVGSTTIDSAVVGSSVIWWTDQDTYDGALVDVLKLKLGHQSLSAGAYEDCRITYYDPARPNGDVWSEDMTIEVKA